MNLCSKAIPSLSRCFVYNPGLVVTRSSVIYNCLPMLQQQKAFPDIVPNHFRIQLRQYAARKGTRTRKEKKKVKKEEVKRVFIFKSLRKLQNMVYEKQRPFEDPKLPLAVDDTFFQEKFQTVSYTFAEAVQNHKDVHQPDMYNVPNSPLILRVDIDLVYPNRPNKFQDGWRNIIEMRSPFLLEGMTLPTVLAFCPDDTDLIAETIKAGGDLVGSNEIIKSIQEGHINPEDYDHLVAHPSIVTDLSSIRGLIKKKFPSIKTKTVNTDVPGAVKRLKSGIQIKVVKNDREPDFGYIETPIGKLDMEISELEGNFEAVFLDTVTKRVNLKLPEDYILKCSLTTPHTKEVLKIDISKYLKMVDSLKKKPVEKNVSEEEISVSAAPAAMAQ